MTRILSLTIILLLGRKWGENGEKIRRKWGENREKMGGKWGENGEKMGRKWGGLNKLNACT